MPVKAEKIKFAVGDEVIMDLNGDDTPCKVVRIKGANYITEDAEGTEYECEPHELKLAGKKKKAATEDDDTPPAKKKKTDDDDDTPPKKKKTDDDDDKPAKKVGSSWNTAKPAEKMSGGLPLGNWEALAFNGLAEIKGKKGVTVWIDYAGVNDDEVKGKSQRGYYTIKDEDGDWTQGTEIMKRDLLMLGFTEEQLEVGDEDDLDELVESLNKILKKLRKMETWVSIKVVPNKQDKSRTNLYLNGPMDDQSDKPKNPMADKPF